jgi:hypothetical protein
MTTLTCRICKSEKPNTGFSPSKTAKSGYRSECKACGTARAKAWNLANAERVREAGRRRYAEDPTKKREAAKKWCDANLEQAKESRAKWASENTGKVREQVKRWAEANPERYREICRNAEKRWIAANPEKISEKRKRHYLANREKKIEQARLHRALNPENLRESLKRYAANNPHKLRANERRRQAAKMERTPPWFGEFDQFVMESAYSLCKLREAVTGIEWHVDHMIPLRAKTASGLHIGINTQVIPEILNQRKSNKLLYTNPGEWVKDI